MHGAAEGGHGVTKNPILFRAGVSGFCVVALGAFGAHVVQGGIPERLFAAYQTGVQYHALHTLALLATAILYELRSGDPRFVLAGRFFLAGILLFSGSLYLMALTGHTFLGWITPFGGLAFLVGWGMLARSARGD